jgi:hypothetical protein
MWTPKGKELPPPPWASFDATRTLGYHDGQRAVVSRSEEGQWYLGWWNDADQTKERWLYVPLSQTRLRAVLSGAMPVRHALLTPEEGQLYIVDYDAESGDVQRAYLASDLRHVPADTLPDVRIILELSGIEDLLKQLAA